jgi:hypothetical protein
MNRVSRGFVVWMLTIMLVLALSLACKANDVGGAAPTATELPLQATQPAPTKPGSSTEVVPTIPPSDTPVPESPTPAPTDTPSEVTVTAAGGDVACRFGPASEYSIDGKLASGVTTLGLARNSTSSWIRIEHQTHPGWNCWLKAADVVVSGNLASVPVEPAPAAIVTDVTVEVSPSAVTVPGCVFPYTVSVEFRITVNGPATVSFQRSLDNGNKAPVESQTFAAFGTYSFTDHLRLGSVGEHWFQVDVTSPNAMSGRGTAVASCP